MMSPARVLLLASTAAFLALPQAARAFDGKQQAKTIAPYLDEGTIAVARVDLTKVDVADVFKALPKFLPIPPRELAHARSDVSKFVASLAAQKVGEIYAVVSLTDLPTRKPFLIVPVGAGGDHGTVASLMYSGKPDGPSGQAGVRRGSPFEICTQLGNVVFCGPKKTLDRLKSAKPSPRPNLATAFDAVSEAAVQVAVVPSKDHHRVISELMPRLPKAFGGLTGVELAKAVRWKAIGVELPPKLKATVIVDSQDANSAKKLRAAFFSLTKLLAKNPEIQKSGVDIEQLAKLLNPTVQGNQLRITFVADSDAGKQAIALFGGAVGQARASANRAQSRNNLKQFGLAMHNFHDTYRSFPPVASFKKEKKLLSWRVYVLPYLDADDLFKQFHLDEAWDSPHNKKLIAKMPKVFADPSGKLKKAGMTRYMVPVGGNFIFDGKPEGLSFRDITDGTSNTILLVEAAPESAVIWTKPDDLNVNAKNPFKGLVGKGAKGFLATIGDGSVRLITTKTSAKTLNAVFTRNGGEVVSGDDLK